MRVIRFGMGAREMRSGRKPSMLRMMARRIAGRAVCVGDRVLVDVGVIANVGTVVIVDVGLRTGDNVIIGVGVKVRVDNWHAIRSASRRAYII